MGLNPTLPGHYQTPKPLCQCPYSSMNTIITCKKSLLILSDTLSRKIRGFIAFPRISSGNERHSVTILWNGQKRGVIGNNLRKAVITGDTVTRLSIPIRGRCYSPEEGQRWNLAETQRKKKQHKKKKLPRWGQKKSAINKKINSQIKKPHLKMIPIKKKKKNNSRLRSSTFPDTPGGTPPIFISSLLVVIISITIIFIIKLCF